MSPGPIRPGSAGGSRPSGGTPPEPPAPSEEEVTDLAEEESLTKVDVLAETEVSEPTAPLATAPVNPDATVNTGPRRRHHGAFARLYYGETRFEFVRRSRIWFAISAVIILAGIVSLATRGLNLSIDFVGGTSWEVTAPANLTATQVRDALPPSVAGATVTFLGQKSSQTLNVEARLTHGKKAVSDTEANAVAGVLAHLTGHKHASDVSISSVGPSWGGQITHKAIVALIVFFILIAIYISIFFEWRMALAAIIAVVHDIIVTVGIYSLSFFLVTPDTVVAILTILGYSLYDTIVVFDRIRANLKGVGSNGRISLTDIVNLSMNQTLARSMNTSLVAILPILAVLVLGADLLGATTLQYFGLALLVGLATGAYSSIFIASPIVALLKEREPRWRIVHDRLVSRGGDRVLLSAAVVAGGAFGEAADGPNPRRARRGGAAGPIRPGTAQQGADAVPEPTAATSNGAPRPANRPAARRPAGGRSRPAARNRKKGGRR